jgi:hypothetical protein
MDSRCSGQRRASPEYKNPATKAEQGRANKLGLSRAEQSGGSTRPVAKVVSRKCVTRRPRGGLGNSPRVSFTPCSRRPCGIWASWHSGLTTRSSAGSSGVSYDALLRPAGPRRLRSPTFSFLDCSGVIAISPATAARYQPRSRTAEQPPDLELDSIRWRALGVLRRSHRQRGR